MAKSLSERIAERLSTRHPSRSGKNRAAFLAVRDDVKNALDDGWSVKVIWETLRDEGKIEFGYDAFIGYVNQLIRNANPAITSPVKRVKTNEPAAKTQEKRSAPEEEPKKEKPAIGGFSFNPKPNKEELL